MTEENDQDLVKVYYYYISSKDRYIGEVLFYQLNNKRKTAFYTTNISQSQFGLTQLPGFPEV